MSLGYGVLFTFLVLILILSLAGHYYFYKHRQRRKQQGILVQEQMRRIRRAIKSAASEDIIFKSTLEALVPRLAPWVLVIMNVEDSGRAGHGQIYAAHGQADKIKVLEETAKKYQGQNLLQALATDEQYVALRKFLDFHSVMELPLKGRAGAVLGTVLIRIADSQIESIESILDVCALSVENLRQIKANEATRLALNDTLEVVNRDVKMGLMSILLNADLLLERIPFQQEAESPYSQAGKIKIVSRQIQSIIGDLADAARLKAGIMSFRPTSEDVQELLDEAFSIATEEKAHEEISAAPSLKIQGAKNLEAYCDGNRTLLSFSRIFRALIQARGAPGAKAVMDAKISADKNSNQVVISIAGVGCSDKDLQDIFQKKNNFSLAMAKGFLEAQGGGMSIGQKSDGSAIIDLRLPQFRVKKRGAVSSGAA